VLNGMANVLPRGQVQRTSGRAYWLRVAFLMLLSAALAFWLQHTRGWGWGFVTQMAYCQLLLVIAVIDLEHRIVPDVLVAFGMLLAVGFNLAYPMPGLAAALKGTALGGGAFLLLAVIGRGRALGMGDVKLAALIGMMTGAPWVVLALTLGIAFGGVVAAALILTRVRGPKEHIPYAPYLVLGGVVTLLYGPRIMAWYLALLASKG